MATTATTPPIEERAPRPRPIPLAAPGRPPAASASLRGCAPFNVAGQSTGSVQPRRTLDMLTTDMLITVLRRSPSCLSPVRKTALSAMTAAMIAARLVCPAGAEPNIAPAPHDPRVLADIARDVLRRGATGPIQAAPEPTLPASAFQEPTTEIEVAVDPDSPSAPLAAAREGITVAIPPESARPKKKMAPQSATTGYQSNSWRQKRADTARALSFSSGALAPATGLDPALKTHADALRAEGRQFVYGFVLLRDQPDEALERKLAKFGARLLGPHDDHYKARLPVGSLEAIAALPEVEWVGVSAWAQKQSAELAELLDSRGHVRAVDDTSPIPIVINLFEKDETGAFRRQLEAAGVALGEYDAGLAFYRAVAAGPAIERVTALDFVLFLELIGRMSGATDQSTVLVDADMIRPGTPLGLTRFSGASVPIGIMDSGFAANQHYDLLGRKGCGF